MALERVGHTEPLCSAGCCAPSLPGCAPCRDKVGAAAWEHRAPAVSVPPLQLHAQGIQPGVLPAAFGQGGPLLWPCFGEPIMLSKCRSTTTPWRAIVAVPMEEATAHRKERSAAASTYFHQAGASAGCSVVGRRSSRVCRSRRRAAPL